MGSQTVGALDSQALKQIPYLTLIAKLNGNKWIGWYYPQDNFTFTHVPLEAADGPFNETILRVRNGEVTFTMSNTEFVAAQQAAFAHADPTVADAGECGSPCCASAMQYPAVSLTWNTCR